jgi:hypothetical protein
VNGCDSSPFPGNDIDANDRLDLGDIESASSTVIGRWSSRWRLVSGQDLLYATGTWRTLYQPSQHTSKDLPHENSIIMGFHSFLCLNGGVSGFLSDKLITQVFFVEEEMQFITDYLFAQQYTGINHSHDEGEDCDHER